MAQQPAALARKLWRRLAVAKAAARRIGGENISWRLWQHLRWRLAASIVAKK